MQDAVAERRERGVTLVHDGRPLQTAGKKRGRTTLIRCYLYADYCKLSGARVQSVLSHNQIPIAGVRHICIAS